MIARVGEETQQFIYVPPEGVTIHNAKISHVDLPFTVSYEFIGNDDDSKLGEATEYLLDPQLVSNILQVVNSFVLVED